MRIINLLLGVPLGFIIYFSYRMSGSYGVAILIFAVIIRVILYPVSVLAHKNAIRFLKLQPALSVIKRRYAGDKEQLNEEQYELFKKERYNVFYGLFPLILQLLLIMGMLQVMYHPLQHMLRLDADVIEALVSAYHNIYDVQASFMDQLLVLQALQSTENLTAFHTALLQFGDAPATLNLIINTNLSFLGMDLGVIPSLRNPSIELIIPLLSGIFAWVFCAVQNKISPGALTQSDRANMGMTIFTVLLSVYFSLVMPAGVGLYWAAGNLFGIVVTIILDVFHSPKKLAAEAIEHLEANRKTPAELKAEKQRQKALAAREKIDAPRFAAAKKQLVFYAISGGQYKFYKNIIEYLFEHSDLVIHYLTNDPNDGVFNLNHERLIPYYAGQSKSISLLLKLNTQMFVTTVPDLQSYHMKRSIVREDIEYVHIVHGLTSTHMAAREKAYDYFDTIFCVGPHQANEIKQRVKLAGLAPKRLVKAGYGLYDQLVNAYQQHAGTLNKVPLILIAPSWQTDNILESCIDEILNQLLGQGYQIIVRPHIQFTNMFPERMDELAATYAKYMANGELIFDLDFSENKYIFTSDLLLTDWSGIAYEFSYCSLKPSVFINTPMKVLNPNYEDYGVEVLDITLRDKVGVSIDLDQLDTLSMAVANLLTEKEAYKHKIEEAIRQYLYYPNRSGEAGARYIMGQLEKK